MEVFNVGDAVKVRETGARGEITDKKDCECKVFGQWWETGKLRKVSFPKEALAKALHCPSRLGLQEALAAAKAAEIKTLLGTEDLEDAERPSLLLNIGRRTLDYMEDKGLNEVQQYCLFLEADTCEDSEHVLIGKWSNPFTSLGEDLAACLPPLLDPGEWAQTQEAEVWRAELWCGDIGNLQAIFTKPTDLLQWRAELCNCEGDHDCVLNYAFANGDLDMLKHLFKLSPKHFMQMMAMRGNRTNSPLQTALARNRSDVVQWMCESGIMTQTLFSECQTKLHYFSSDLQTHDRDTQFGVHGFSSALDAFRAGKVHTWTDAGIDYLIKQAFVLAEPGKPKPFTGREGECDYTIIFDGCVAGAEVTQDQIELMYDVDDWLEKMYDDGYFVEAPLSRQENRVKSTCEVLLEQWQALSEAEKRDRTESLFSNLIWSNKKVVSVSVPFPPASAYSSGPTTITCSHTLTGEDFATFEINLHEAHATELMSKIAALLQESKYAFEVVLPGGRSLSQCSKTAPLSDILL